MTVQNSLVRKKNNFSLFVNTPNIKELINRSIGANADKFTTSIISLVANNPDLQQCDFNSIISGALLGESLKLSCSPQLGQYYLVPFNDKDKGKVATFIIG